MTMQEDLAALYALLSLLRNEILAFATFKTAMAMWPYIRPRTLHQYQRHGTPSWALVTGANRGIGLAFAEELLTHGFNVLIHGRDETKLKNVKQSLSKQYPRRRIDILVADAASTNLDYDAIVQSVESLPGKLTILINNVGGSPVVPSYAPHEDMPAHHIDTIININARFPTHLTSRLLPILRANSPSTVICCSSTAGALGMPYIASYSATKVFVQGFCKSLKAEMSSSAEGRKGGDVSVHALMVGEVETSVQKGGSAQFYIVSARQFAASALNKVGCSRTLLWGHWRHALQFQILNTLPERLMTVVTAYILKQKMAEELRELKRE